MGLVRFSSKGYSLTVIAWLLGTCIFYRSVFVSFFHRIIGDPGDGQLIISLHEHWYRVLRGLESWNETIFFYPVQNSLGYSDTFLFTGILYSGLRHLGADPFIALQGVLFLLTTIGFWAMYSWLTSCRALARPVAAFGGLLFIIASPIFLSARNSHIQLLSVWLLPVGLILIERCIIAIQGKRLIWFPILCLCTWFGFLAYSTFYVAFFFALLGLIGGAFAVLVRPRGAISVVRSLRSDWRQYVPGAIVMGLTAALFLYTYVPVHEETGGRVFEEVLPRIPVLADLFNHTRSNLLWGIFNDRFWPYSNPHNRALHLGLTPLLGILAILSSLVTLVWGLAKRQAIPAVLAFVFLAGLSLLFRTGDQTVWRFVFDHIPGASAIRVPSRLSLVLLIPAILMICLPLHGLLMRNNRWGTRFAVTIATVVLLEQIQLVNPANLYRSEKLELASRATPPPSEIEAFLAYSEPWEGWNKDVPQNTATFLAEQWNLPTINGRSGFAPSNWNFFDMNREQGLGPLIEWATVSGITGKIGLYDMTQNRWLRTVDFGTKPEHSLMDIDLFTLLPDGFDSFQRAGWSEPELWGIWSNAEEATFAFTSDHFRSPAAALSIKARAFVHSQHPVQDITVFVNERQVATLTFTLAEPVREETLHLPNDIGLIRSISFSIPDPCAPSSLGMGEDKRLLGIGIESLTLLSE